MDDDLNKFEEMSRETREGEEFVIEKADMRKLSSLRLQFCK